MLKTSRWRWIVLPATILAAGCGIGKKDSADTESANDPIGIFTIEGDVNSLIAMRGEVDFASHPLDENRNLLHIARTAEVVEFLIGEGVDVNQMSVNGWTPLHALAQWGKADSVEALIAAGVPVDQPAGRHGPSMAFLERRHADRVDDTPGELLFGCSVGGCTALHGAAATGKLEVIETLIRLGLDPDVAGAYDLRPLHVAARMGEVESAALLIELGASTDVRTESGLLPSDMIATEPDLIDEERRERLYALLAGVPETVQ